MHKKIITEITYFKGRVIFKCRNYIAYASHFHTCKIGDTIWIEQGETERAWGYFRSKVEN